MSEMAKRLLTLLWPLLVVVSSTTGRSNTSGLCRRTSSFQSCAHQLYGHDGQNLCRVQECIAGTRTTAPEAGGGLCDVRLSAYRHVLPGLPLPRTALNLTFSCEPGRYWTSYLGAEENFTFCLDWELTATGQVWYDCPFLERRHEGRPMALHFLSNTCREALLFRMPTIEMLNLGQSFFYLHYKQKKEPFVTFETSDVKKKYSILLCHWQEGTCVQLQQVIVDVLDNSTYQSKFDKFVTVPLETTLLPGDYILDVENESFPFTIFDDEQTSYSSVVALASGTALLLGGLLGGVLLHRRRRRRRDAAASSSSSSSSGPPQTLLLVYDPEASDERHLEGVRVFLESVTAGRLRVWLDVVEIPCSGHQDPLAWYVAAFDAADRVAVWLGAPPPTSRGIYENTFGLALDLLASRIKRGASAERTPPIGERYAVLHATADADAVAAPELCRPFRRFRLPQQAAELVRWLQLDVSVERRDAGLHQLTCSRQDTINVENGCEEKRLLPLPQSAVSDDDDDGGGGGSAGEEEEGRRKRLDADFGAEPPAAQMVDAEESSPASSPAVSYDWNLL